MYLNVFYNIYIYDKSIYIKFNNFFNVFCRFNFFLMMYVYVSICFSLWF